MLLVLLTFSCALLGLVALASSRDHGTAATFHAAHSLLGAFSASLLKKVGVVISDSEGAAAGLQGSNMTAASPPPLGGALMKRVVPRNATKKHRSWGGLGAWIAPRLTTPFPGIEENGINQQHTMAVNSEGFRVDAINTEDVGVVSALTNATDGTDTFGIDGEGSTVLLAAAAQVSSGIRAAAPMASSKVAVSVR